MSAVYDHYWLIVVRNRRFNGIVERHLFIGSEAAANRAADHFHRVFESKNRYAYRALYSDPSIALSMSIGDTHHVLKEITWEQYEVYQNELQVYLD